MNENPTDTRGFAALIRPIQEQIESRVTELGGRLVHRRERRIGPGVQRESDPVARAEFLRDREQLVVARAVADDRDIEAE